MVFIVAQLNAFFTSADYLDLSARTVAAFAAEGIVTPEDLEEFNRDGLDAIFCNLRILVLSKVVLDKVVGAVLEV